LPGPTFFLTLTLALTLPLFNSRSTCYRCVMSQHWLVKQEPTAYSWDQFAADGKTDWTGVRNFQARNNLRSMKLSDPVFYYHSVNGKAVVGLAKVTKEAFRDPTATEGDWSAVELTPVKPIEPPVTLEQIKGEARLLDMPLLKHPRLSVMKLTKEQFETILDLAKTARPDTL
jgi:predicted RNA-binding protein with PUA-like domain